MADLTALYDEADKLKDAGKNDEAIAKLQQSLSEDPNYTLAHLALAVLCGRVGRHDEAVTHGQRPANWSRKRPSTSRPSASPASGPSSALKTATTSGRRKRRWPRPMHCNTAIRCAGGQTRRLPGSHQQVGSPVDIIDRGLPTDDSAEPFPALSGPAVPSREVWRRHPCPRCGRRPRSRRRFRARGPEVHVRTPAGS